jgi:CO dehydrogenase maturation factor
MSTRIAIAGKGGTGKSTLAALMVCHLCREGEGPVLAVDADPDANLGTLLGVEVEKTLGDLREEAVKKIKDFPAGMSKASYFEAGLHQVIEESEGFDLLTMGRAEGPGCYCYLNNLIKKFSDDLMPSYRWIVIDNEAGLEHISRRTSSNIDALVVVVNNPISINTARSIDRITDELRNEIRRKLVVTNMVDDANIPRIRQLVSELDMEYVCDLPREDRILDASFNIEPLMNLENTAIQDGIKLIIEKTGAENGAA